MYSLDLGLYENRLFSATTRSVYERKLIKLRQAGGDTTEHLETSKYGKSITAIMLCDAYVMIFLQMTEQ